MKGDVNMLKAMADNAIEITAKEDAAMYNTFAGKQNYIFEGFGNEMAVTHSSASLIVVLGTGGAIICGRHVYENRTAGEASSIVLEPNTSGYLVIRYDLSKIAGKEAEFIAVSVLENNDLNNDGLICDLVLGKYTTDSYGVTEYTDLRSFNNLAKRVAELESNGKIYAGPNFTEPSDWKHMDLFVVYE